MSPKAKKLIYNIIIYVVLGLVALIVFIPVIGVVFSAFKSGEEYLTTSKLAPPSSFLYFDNFKEIMENGKVVQGFTNTVIIMACSLFGASMFSTMVAYVINRFEFTGKSLIKSIYLIASFVPGVTTQIVTFNLIKGLGLVNSLGAPILLYVGVDIVSLYLYMQYINEIPRSLDEAALVEGSSYTGVYLRIILPMLKPAIITACIIKGTAIYNDFYTAFLYLPSSNKSVMSTMLYRFMGPYSANWNIIAAGILVVLIPIFIVFVCLQKYIYKGFAEGSIK